MKKLSKLLIAVLALVATAFAPVANVFAEEGENNAWLQVAPVSSRVKLLPGSNNEYSIVVTNNGENELRFSASVAPYTVIDESYNLSFTNETLRTQLTHWIKFVNPDGSITDKFVASVAPNSDIAINYRVSVPDSVPAGGQYAVILVQTETDQNVEGAGVQTIPRVGVVIYGRTDGETEEKSELISFNIPTFMTEGKVSASSVIKNTGNVDFEAKYSFSVKSIIGKELFAVNDKSNIILPDTQRKEEFVWEETPTIGIFQVSYKAEAHGQVLKDETVFVMILPVYLIVIMILLLTIIIIWIIMLIRKRKERKSRLLV
ncbi:hypothetical protein IJG79_01150 [Candidatus Saccharibacteria bacterium]|nr:hypothetical protein [Candidatus Saccharibacteria bacterium]